MDYRRIVYEIGEEDHGKTVLTYLKHKGYSGRVLSALKRNPYGIMIGKKRVTVQKQLRAGDLLTVRIANKETQLSDAPRPVELPLDIVYEDEDVLVVNKPPHMPTHPSMGNHENTLANAVAYHMRGKEFVFRPVHRLDKDTSGLILLGKHAHSAGVLGEQLRRKEIVRTYLAVLRGVPDPCSGVIDAPIARVSGSLIARQVDPKGDRAVTHYRVLAANNGYALVRMQLETGRTHQIRVHMAHRNAPVAGDFLYGCEEPHLNRQALHSETLRFTHPVTGAQMDFRCPLPEDLRFLVKEKEIPYEAADI